MKLRMLVATVLLTASAHGSAASLQEKLDLADQAFAKQDWVRYGQIYRELTAGSPANGLYWYRVGIAEREQQHRAAAIAAFERAYALGQQRASAARALAILEAPVDGPRAVDWWVRARRDRLTNAEISLMQDPGLLELSQDPRFTAKLFPKIKDGARREARWAADLDFLDLRMRESQWGFEAFSEAWEQGLARLRRELPKLADWQVQVRLDALVRLAKSGHSWVLPAFDGPDPFHLAPLRLEAFRDGWFVTAAAPQWQHLLGKRVDKIAGLAPDAALERLRPLVPHESEAGLRTIGQMLMTIPEYLLALGHGKDRTVLPLEVDGKPVDVAAAPLTQAMIAGVLQVHGLPAGWRSASVAALAPAWQRQPDTNAWLETLKDDGLVYAQLNAVRDGALSLSAFAAQLEQALTQDGVRGLVLDVRLNQGGNGDLNETILRALAHVPAMQTPGHLYVLISGRTFSAASLLIGDLEQRFDPIFVGTESGSGPTHIGEDNFIVLPNMGVKVMAATRHFVRSKSDDQRAAIAPHLYVVPSFAEWKAGRDPVLDAVLNDWRGRQPSAKE